MIAGGVGWILAGWLYLRRRKEPLTPLTPQPVPAQQIHTDSLKMLKQACKSADLPLVRNRLVDFLQAHYSTSAQEAVRRFQLLDTGARVMNDLNTALYSNAVSPEDHRAIAELTLRAAQALRKVSEEPVQRRGLPALYSRSTRA
jgi:hypothetical protein